MHALHCLAMHGSVGGWWNQLNIARERKRNGQWRDLLCFKLFVCFLRRRRFKASRERCYKSISIMLPLFKVENCTYIICEGWKTISTILLNTEHLQQCSCNVFTVIYDWRVIWGLTLPVYFRSPCPRAQMLERQRRTSHWVCVGLPCPWLYRLKLMVDRVNPVSCWGTHVPGLCMSVIRQRPCGKKARKGKTSRPFLLSILL